MSGNTFMDDLKASQVKVAKVPLAGGLANAFAFAWKNPEETDIIVQKVVVDITTEGVTATSVIDIGVGATATTASNTIIDGLPATALKIADNITDKGTSGTGLAQRVNKVGGTSAFITGQILVANAAALAGNVYIEYLKV